VRLLRRQLTALEQRARRESVGLSEAVRRCLDEWAARSRSPPSPRARPPTHEKQETFDQVFAAFGLRPARRHQPSKRPRPSSPVDKKKKME
jgi:hypothetical protein